jgi:hypothetical protein
VFDGLVKVSKDGRSWQIGTISEVRWIANGTTGGLSITAAIPPVFETYATFYEPDGVTTVAHERAVVNRLVEITPDQPWWLGYLDTGAHSVVFEDVPKVLPYWDWPYVLVAAGPNQALTWRTGHMRAQYGVLPDLFFPEDRSWLVSALWDDTWTCVGDRKLSSKPFTTIHSFRRAQSSRVSTPHHRDAIAIDETPTESNRPPYATATPAKPRCRHRPFTHHLLRPDLAAPQDGGFLPAVPARR